MNRITSLKIIGTALGFALLSSGAEASILLYTNKAAFLSAAGAMTMETFASTTASTSTSSYSNAFDGFTLNSVANGNRTGITTNGLASSGDNTAIPTAFTGQNYFGWGNYAGSPGASSTFTFGAPLKAFGFDWFNTDVTDNDDVTANGSTTFAQAIGFANSYAATGFIGILATGADLLSSILIHSNATGGYVSDAGIDNVMVSAAAKVPEPATLSLIGLALAGMTVATRRKRTTA